MSITRRNMNEYSHKYAESPIIIRAGADFMHKNYEKISNNLHSTNKKTIFVNIFSKTY